ncbi:MAG TPA: DUF2092 domain-containing protein [Burkholderiales bacterium]|nr:DUF2092 domain-containing protein [Burkholderiales bacterium]
MTHAIKASPLVVALACGLAAGYASAQPAPAARPAPTASEARAREVLAGMGRFVAGVQSFSVKVQAAFDTVQRSGEKIEFGEARTITLSRPDRLRVESERSDGRRVTTVFDGKEIVLVDATANVYATAAQRGGIDDAVKYFVGDLGMRLPLALLLVSTLPDELDSRVRSIRYVERTSLYGAPAHHLAARTATTDVQIWIADGDQPFPQRVVITYRTAAGRPQYRAMLTDWNVAPGAGDATFSLKPPAGAQKVAFAAQLPRLATGARMKRAGAVK